MEFTANFGLDPVSIHNKANISSILVFFVFIVYILLNMRTATYDTITAHAGDEMLTTGEAAKLLNSSRQHIVDLCERGELPFTTVGTHRRVHRVDVEAVKARTQRLNKDQRRSLWLAYAIAGRIAEDPTSALRLASRNLETMRRTSRGQATRWLDEWERLLKGPIENVFEQLVSRASKGRELRQNAPFAGLLTDTERQNVLSAWRNQEQ